MYVHFCSPISSPHGVTRQGDRLRGSDPVVQGHSPRFVPDGTPPRDWPPDPEFEQLQAAARAGSAAERAITRAVVGKPRTIHEPPPEATITVTHKLLIRVAPDRAAIELQPGDRLPTTEWLIAEAGDSVTPTSSPKAA